MRLQRALAVAAVGAGLVLAIALLVHVPLVRSAALRYAIATVERQYGVRLEAVRLDYNLATLRVGLAELRAAAPHAGDEPFFTAEYLAVRVSPRVIVGGLRFTDIRATGARVIVRRSADGTSNLPASTGAPPGAEPAPLRMDRLELPRLAVDLRDEQAVRSLWLPGISILLGPDDGRVQLESPGDIRTATQEGRLTRLEGPATFDGRTLSIDGVQLATSELAATLDGTVTLITREPALDLRFAGSGDATGLARWAVSEGDLPRGRVVFDGAVAGAFEALDLRTRVASDRVEWGTLAAVDADARVRVTAAAVEVDEARFGFAGGRVEASVSLPLEPTAAARMRASWTGVDAAAALRAFVPAVALVPSAVIDGQLEGEGLLSELRQWAATVHLDVAAGPLAPSRVPLDGPVDLTLRDGAYRLLARQQVARTALLGMAIEGEIGDPVGRTTVNGSLQLGATEGRALLAALRTLGLTGVDAETVSAGTIAGEFTMVGIVGDPAVDGRLLLRDLAGPQVEIAAAEITLTGQPMGGVLDFTAAAPSAAYAGQSVIDVSVAGRLAPSAGGGVRARTGTTVFVDSMSARQPGGTGLLTANGTYEFATQRYAAAMDAEGWSLVPTPDLPVSASVDLRLTGEGTVAAPAAAGRALVRDAVVRDIALGAIDADIAIDGREARLSASAPDFAATSEARVGLDAPYAAVIDLRTPQLSLERLVRDLDLPWAIAGSSAASLHVEMPIDDWRSGVAVLDVTSLEASSRGLSLRLDGPARLEYLRGDIQIDRLEGAVDGLTLSASGRLPVFDAASDSPGLIVTAAGDVEAVARVVQAAGAGEVAIVGGEGPVALLARVTGSFSAPVTAADLDVGPGTVRLQDLPPIANLRLRAHAEDGWVELQSGTASYQGADLSATAKAPVAFLTGAGDADAAAVLHVRVASLTPMVLAPFVEPDALQQLGGSIDATLVASATSRSLSDVTGELRIDRFDLRVADLPITQAAPTRIVARDGFARIEAWDWTGQGATLNVRGQMRLSDRQAAILAGGTVDLRVLTPFARGAGVATSGRLDPRLSITGPIDAPRVDGDLVVSGGEIRLADPRLVATDLSLRTVLNGAHAQIVSLTGSVNGGALIGGGEAEYSASGGLEARLSARIDGMALEYPEGLRSELDASLAVLSARDAATGRQTGTLSGTVTVLRGAYREPLPVLTGFLAGLRTDDVAAAIEGESALDALALDVRIVTDEDVMVDNNVGRFQLGADVQLVGTASSPSLVGRADLREGGQLFVGRNVFAITRGAIDFFNPAAIEPNLNVVAVTRAGGEDIQVTLTGPAEQPETALNSPSAPELGQLDIASILLTGQRLDYLAEGDAAFLTAQVLGNLSPEFLGFASRAVGLDTLRLGGIANPSLRRDLPTVATDVDPTTRMTFGKSVAPNLDVTFSQSLRDSDAQTWVVEYFPGRDIELRLVSDDDNLRAYGFRHELAFGTGLLRVEPGRASVPPRVSRVEFSGTLGLDEARVRQALRLEPGDRFDFGEWQDDRDRLEALYRSNSFLTARIAARRAEEGTDQVALEYEIAAGPRTSIAIVGIDDGALRGAIETAWAESVFDEFLVEEVRELVHEALARDGYLQSAVDVRLADEPGVRVLTVAVKPGARSARTRVRVDGVPDDLAGTVTARLAAQGVVDTAVADPGAVEREALQALRTDGYLQARASAGAPSFEGDEAVLPLAIEPGPRFIVAGVTFEGPVTLPPEPLRDAAGLSAESPYDPAAVESARDRVVGLYRQEGFARASVTTRSDITPGTRAVRVAFIVDEGPRQVLRRIDVVGNRAIDADVIVRTLGLTEGAPLRTDAVIGARRRVQDTGLFRRLDISSQADSDAAADGNTVPMRLRVSVEEWPALRLRYGVVVAEERREGEIEGRTLVPGVSADLIRRTLFGRAVSLGSALDLQRRRQQGRVFLSAPTFAGLPIESSVFAERSRQTFEANSFVTDTTGITWEQRTRVAGNLALSYSYTFERNHTFDTGPLDPEFVFDITVNLARLRAAGAWDTRDDQFNATRGLLASYSFEFAPEAVGSDIRFLRHVAQGYYFRPWRRAVFVSAARLGVVVPLGGQDVIPSARFLAGGSRTVRGVREDGLGPLELAIDNDGNEYFAAVGGQMSLVFNQEVRLPFHRWFGVVGFLDAGNVFARPSDARLQDLVGSAGGGIRITVPFGLLRVDYGRAIWGAPEPAAGRWTFGVGQAF